MARVVIDHLSKAFSGPRGQRTVAVSDLNLTVEDGEFLVLVGPSGCGKTTTLRLLAGFETPDSGAISIDGHSMSGVPPKQRALAMVFQHHALYPHLSAYDNLAFGLRVRGFKKTEIAERISQTAEMLGLSECLARKPDELSGGQRQRVALGRAVVRRPKLFLLDEPLSNLDPPMRASMRSEISALHRALGAAFIYVTHDQVEAMTLGQRIAVMKDGTLQQVGPPLELYRRPTNLFTAKFIGSPEMNIFEGTIFLEAGRRFFQEKTTGESQGFRVPVQLDSPAQGEKFPAAPMLMGIRPEDILVYANPGAAPSPREFAGPAIVDWVDRLGPEAFLHGKTSAHRFKARVPADCPMSSGQSFSLGFNAERMHFFEPTLGKRVDWLHATSDPARLS